MDEIPSTLDEAVEKVKELTCDSDEDLAAVKSMSEDEILSRIHHGLGRWIRNNWGLWEGSPLKTEIEKLGLHHADDMSGIILKCAIRDIQGRERDVPGMVKFYQDYWEKNK